MNRSERKREKAALLACKAHVLACHRCRGRVRCPALRRLQNLALDASRT